MTTTANLLSLIGNTPLLEVTHLDTGLCKLFLKLECNNPGGSIKDRVGLSMITQAEKEGQLKPGFTIIEATAGNTGLGLALVASQRGYPLVLVIPDKMSQEKINHLRALGAKIVMTRSDVEKGHPEYYQDLAQKIARETPNSFYANQFNNPSNPLAHETTTAPEIWEQMDHKVDAVVCGVGSGGTLTGLSRYFSRVSPTTEFVLADPQGSILADYVMKGTIGTAGSWFVEGIGEDFIPSIADLSRTKKAYKITDEESFSTCRQLLAKEGVLAGSSTGTLLAASLRYCRESKTTKRVVTFVCDTGNKYLSKMYNDYWLIDHGLLPGKKHHDLRDLVTRTQETNAITSVHPDDTLLVAHSRMRIYEYSQLPVIEDRNVIGVIDEFDLLSAIQSGKGFEEKIRSVMAYNLVKVQSDKKMNDIFNILEKGMVVLLYHEDTFFGMITRTDLLNYLRKNPHEKI
ncbi:MAG: pyridoxal-phosphate dependent enzyme [Bdellovibrio sp.]|nr:pyridoxal-phosphate dependent enzyme [Bdellovibrio sp.]